jgi:hypothetical protein
MDRDTAARTLAALHEAQNRLYAGGERRPPAARAGPAASSIRLVPGSAEDARIAECWLLPLDPITFDRVWSPPA